MNSVYWILSFEELFKAAVFVAVAILLGGCSGLLLVRRLEHLRKERETGRSSASVWTFNLGARRQFRPMIWEDAESNVRWRANARGGKDLSHR